MYIRDRITYGNSARFFQIYELLRRGVTVEEDVYKRQRLFCMGSPQIRTERIFSWSPIIYIGHIRHFTKLYYYTALFEHEPNPILFELYFAFRQFMNKRMNILPLFSFFLITACLLYTSLQPVGKCGTDNHDPVWREMGHHP